MNSDNFLITPHGLKLIDFDYGLIGFDKPFAEREKMVAENFATMLNNLSQKALFKDYPEVKSMEKLSDIKDFIINLKRNTKH